MLRPLFGPSVKNVKGFIAGGFSQCLFPFSVSVVCLLVLLFGLFEHWLQGQILLLLASMIQILTVKQTQPEPMLTQIKGAVS